MFSLHIDTAQTWRGGQSQVRYTVLGLRAIGHRAALVADPAGALFQRMSEGLDLVPLSTRGEIDLAAAWRLSRVLKQLRPDVAACARSERGGHGRHGALDRDAAPAAARSSPPVASSSRSRATRFRPGSTRRSIASSPSAAPCAIAWSPIASRRRRSRSSTKASTSSASSRLPHGNLHAALFLPTHSPIVGTIGALVAQKDHHTLDRGRGDRRQAGVGRQVRHPWRGRAAAAARETDQTPAPRASRIPRRIPRRRARAAEGRRRVRAQLDARGHVHVAAGRHGRRKAGRGDRRRRRARKSWTTRKPASWCRHANRRRWPRASVQLLKDQALRRRMGRAGLDRVRRLFTVERMVQETGVRLRTCAYGIGARRAQASSAGTAHRPGAGRIRRHSSSRRDTARSR